MQPTKYTPKTLQHTLPDTPTRYAMRDDTRGWLVPAQRDDGAHMEPYELTTCSFIVKFWIEEPAAEGGRASWRGSITHIPSGQRRYFDEYEEIRDFVHPFLRAIGITLGDTPALN